jgi:hypothetical protein
VIQIDSNNSMAHYDIACIRSIKLQLNEAFKYLELAIKKGLFNYELIQNDEDLVAMMKEKVQWHALMKKYFPEKFK